MCATAAALPSIPENDIIIILQPYVAYCFEFSSTTFVTKDNRVVIELSRLPGPTAVSLLTFRRLHVRAQFRVN